MRKAKAAFLCVHNSCRSRIAEAMGKHLRGDTFEFYSAGMEIKPQINQDAVRLNTCRAHCSTHHQKERQPLQTGGCPLFCNGCCFLVLVFLKVIIEFYTQRRS